MPWRVGTPAHFQHFLEKGNSPFEYGKVYAIEPEIVDELQQKRFAKIDRETRKNLENVFMPLLSLDKTEDNWFPAPGFETSDRKLQKRK